MNPLPPLDLPLLLEGTMLACFGLAWPLANLRMLRTRRPEGKGLGFTLVVLCGYLAGASAKLLLTAAGAALAPVFWLYLLNAGSVGLNLFLQWHLARPGRAGQPGSPAAVADGTASRPRGRPAG